VNITGRNAIGHTALTATAMGFGSGPIGNRYRRISDNDAQLLVDDAWDRGIRTFDTAPMYGHGLAERRLGQALYDRPRAEFVVSSKVGRRLRPAAAGTFDTGLWVDVPPQRIVFDYSYEGAMRSVDDTLQRTLLDRIDVIFIHDPDAFTHGGDHAAVFEQAMTGAYHALLRLREEGVIGAIGVGTSDAQVCIQAADRGDFDCFLLAGRYTLLEQDPLDDLLPICQRRGISLFIGGVYNSGILATGARPGANYNYAPATPEILARTAELEAVCREYEVPLATVALQFVAAHPAVASILTSAPTVEQQARNIESAQTPIPPGLWAALRQQGLLRPDAPTP
jgi:D-threo-aldose 1-dehydrogenase